MPPRMTLMWMMIGSLMAVIIVGWILVLRSRPLSTSSGNGPLRTIVEQIANFFSTARQPAEENPTNTSNEKIDELRNRVFPEFTNTTE
ncbi:MAG: hypothetical protein HY566_00070 [Candidatus Kerfeldbacteria bacterium]|nr:hypothetical protein [Candidatus Kerfeldbacteria bacterium]